MKEHHPTDEVQPQEHRQREGDVDGHPLRALHPAVIGELGGPEEEVLARDGMDGTDDQLHHYPRYPLPRHCYSPVIRAVVNHEQLWRKDDDRNYCVRVTIAISLFYLCLLTKMENRRERKKKGK